MDLVSDARDELYAAHPDKFIARRKELAVAARAAGDQQAATAIGELRRPTRSAWVVNQFVRSEPDALSPLIRVGAELRQAHRKLDGAQLRELTVRRRAVVDDSVRRAIKLSGAQSETVRSEVVATFEAVVSDPASAAEVEEATLVRPLEWSGFGDFGPTLAVVQAPKKAVRPLRSATAASQERAAEEEAIRRRRTMAEAELAGAEEQLAKAEARVADAQQRIGGLEAELADARDALKKANADRRAAQAHQQSAQRRLHRLGG
jgi:hypothetical protein